MSIQSAGEFRQLLNSDESLQEQVRDGLADGTADLVQLGSQRGYDFSADELREISKSGEISDFEMEVVAGGFQVSTINTVKG